MRLRVLLEEKHRQQMGLDRGTQIEWRVEKELQEYYANEDAFVQDLARHFPATKTALIDERNAFMAAGIVRAKRAGPVVVAVVGEGHVSGIREELIRLGERPEEIQTVSLQELQGPAKA